VNEKYKAVCYDDTVI